MGAVERRPTTTRKVIEDALRRLEREAGIERGKLRLEKRPGGRACWIVVTENHVPFGDKMREARDMVDTIRFAERAARLGRAGQ